MLAMRFTAALATLLVFNVAASWARVVRVELESRAPVLNGKAFGLAGAYEKLVGKVRFEVDPSKPANTIITDIAHAPRNSAGLVEFSADFYIIEPVDASRGNGTVLCEINNRGRKGVLGMFNHAAGSLDPSSAEHFGDGWLLREGYTLLWVGWQPDPPHLKGRMRLYPATASGANEVPIQGLARADFVVNDRVSAHTLADRDHVPYAVADLESDKNVLTVRDSVEAPRRVIPREKWRFARMEQGAPIADSGQVWIEGGFEPGKIYEVVYLAQNPPIIGLGPASVRDFAAYLKHGKANNVGVRAGEIRRAIAFGSSQSGRFLRTFLYYGYNRDEEGRRALDAVMSHVAGGGRGSFNHRFAQPSRDAHPYMNFFYPTDIFPFTDAVQKDPESGLEGGIQARYQDTPELRPKVFYTNSSYEYWGRAASLIHTTIDGKRDVDVPDNVRIYHFAGSQHGPASFPPTRSIGQQLSNPMNFRWPMRALLRALNRWADSGEEPPPSRYGRIADRTLVAPEKLPWPKLPGVTYSTRIHKAYRADYGPRFYSEGIVDNQPPKIGEAFPMLVPAVDADGNETAGIRLPEQAVPLATYAGWNLFNAKSGPTNEISSMQGSYIPFAETAAERKAKGDPRPSIGERYTGRNDYLGRVAEVAVQLADEGYLLDEDVPDILKAAAKHWDHLVDSR